MNSPHFNLLPVPMALLRCDPNLKLGDEIHILDSTSSPTKSVGTIESAFGERPLQLTNFDVLNSESVTLIEVIGIGIQIVI